MSITTTAMWLRRGKTFGELGESRENHLDALRLALSIAVILSHAYPIFGLGDFEPLNRFTRGHIDIGKLAVDAFFTISGFLICASWVRSRSIRDYFQKRAARIYPGFIASLLISSFVAAPLGGARIPGWLLQRDTYQCIYRPLLFRHIFTIQGAFPLSACPGNINGSLWTIRFELFCYILIALGGICGALRSRTAMLALFCGALAYYRVNPWIIQLPYFDFLNDLPRLVTYFLAGGVAYCWRDRIPHSWVLFLCLLAFLVISRGRSIALLWPASLSYCVLFVGLHPGSAFQRFARGTDISYGVYLYGFPIQQLCRHYLPGRYPVINFLEAVPLACLAGLASWHWIEKRFLRKAHSRQPLRNTLRSERSEPGETIDHVALGIASS